MRTPIEQLEVGKRYERESGEKVVIARMNDDTVEPFHFLGTDGWLYNAVGEIDPRRPPESGHVGLPCPGNLKYISKELEKPALELELGITYQAKSGRKVTMVQYIPRGVVLGDDNTHSVIPAHYLGSNQQRYRKDGKMFQIEGQKYDPLVEEFYRDGQEQIAAMLTDAHQLKTNVESVQKVATKLGLLFNFMFIKLH